MKHGTVYFDGARRAFGEEVAAGALLVVSGAETGMAKRLTAGMTNNEAEYAALKLALLIAYSAGVTHLQVFGDSKLVVHQVDGSWKVKKQHLRPLRNRIWELGAQFAEIRIGWVPRAENARADELCEIVLDSGADVYVLDEAQLLPQGGTMDTEPTPTGDEQTAGGRTPDVTFEDTHPGDAGLTQEESEEDAPEGDPSVDPAGTADELQQEIDESQTGTEPSNAADVQGARAPGAPVEAGDSPPPAPVGSAGGAAGAAGGDVGGGPATAGESTAGDAAGTTGGEGGGPATAGENAT